jgi:hypothetical protein
MEDYYFNPQHLGLTQSINNSFIRNESSYYLEPTGFNSNLSQCYYFYNGKWTLGYHVVRMNYSIYFNIYKGFVTDNTQADYILFPVMFKTGESTSSNTYFGVGYYCISARSLDFDFYYEFYTTYNSGFCSANYSINGGSSPYYTAALVDTVNNFNNGFLVDNSTNKRVQHTGSSNELDICYISRFYSFGSNFGYPFNGGSSYKLYVSDYDSSHLIRAFTAPTTEYLNKRFNEGFEEGKVSGGSGGLSLIGESFEKMGGLLSIQILPNFTLGALISIPLMFILLTFMIRMFKGGN